jgi:hypothetical protein
MQEQARVIPIRATASKPAGATGHITQEKLQRGAELMEAQTQIARQVLQFRLDLDAELAVGAEIEPGALTFDRALRMVRPARRAVANF